MSKFNKLVGKLEKQGNSADSSRRIAAAQGRKELGQKEMTRRSVEGRKKADKK